jgi:hypothetical protein
MPDWPLEENRTGTNPETGAERTVNERMRELGRRSGEARRRKREAKEKLSVDDLAERELDRLLSSSDPKEREKGLRQYGYMRGKRPPTPAKQEVDDPGADDTTRGIALEELAVTIFAYAPPGVRVIERALALAEASAGHQREAAAIRAYLAELRPERWPRRDAMWVGHSVQPSLGPTSDEAVPEAVSSHYR